MQSRTIREGSVGLLILLGVGLFGLLLLWLRGLNPGARSYDLTAVFADVGGMQPGAPVRYRGVTVGQVTEIRPGIQGVEVGIEIASAAIIVPDNALFQVNQSGFIGEASVDITPREEIPPVAVNVNPLSADCPNSTILCDGDRIQGEVGVSFNELISATIELTNLLADPGFFGEIRNLTRNTSSAAAEVADLSRQVTRLTQSVERELRTLSASAAATTVAIGRTATQFGSTAAQVNSLLSENRTSLSRTLNNLSQTSDRLRIVVSEVSPLIEEGEFIRNLEVLSANAAAASASFRSLAEGFDSTENLLLLQQTLESARATFQNAQKITADLDDLTGDPEFRENVRDLVDGLNDLVSSTHQLEEQTQIAQTFTPTEIPLDKPDPSIKFSVTDGPTRLTLLDPSYNIQFGP